jgi:hypothetical protein
VKPPPYTLHGYQPHPGQLELHSSTARFRVAACGRQWGKTISAANEIAKFCWEHPAGMAWWVSPTYGQSAKAFEMIVTGFKDALASKVSSQGHMAVRWQSGGRTEFKSAERWDNLRGETLGFCVLDEAAFMAPEVWEKVIGPMFITTAGRVLFCGTPQGKNWFYALWTHGDDAEYPEWQSFRFPSRSSPYAKLHEIERARRTLPSDAFAQEYEADFLDEAAGVFRNVDACADGEIGPPVEGHTNVIGWDIAKTSDFSVWTVLDADTMQVIAWKRITRVAYSDQLAILAGLARAYDAYTLMDWTGVGDPVLDFSHAANIVTDGYKFSWQGKQKLIEHLAVQMEQHNIHYPPIPELLHELHAFRYEMLPSGIVHYSAPQGMHDDCVMSLALAAWAATHNNLGPQTIVMEDEDNLISPV